MSIMGQNSRCCMVCLMPQSHVSGSFFDRSEHNNYADRLPVIILCIIAHVACSQNSISVVPYLREKCDESRRSVLTRRVATDDNFLSLQTLL